MEGTSIVAVRAPFDLLRGRFAPDALPDADGFTLARGADGATFWLRPLRPDATLVRVAVGMFATASTSVRAALGESLDAHTDPRGLCVLRAVPDASDYDAVTSQPDAEWQPVGPAGLSFADAARMLGGSAKTPAEGADPNGLWDTAEKLFGDKMTARNQRGSLNQSLRAAFGRAGEDELLGAPSTEAPGAADLGGTAPEKVDEIKRGHDRGEVARDMASALRSAVEFAKGDEKTEDKEPSEKP